MNPTPLRWKLLWAATGVLGILFWWMAFHYAPREQQMGDIQRIFYMHLPLAWTAMIALLISAGAHALYLAKGEQRFLTFGWANAWVGTVFSLLVLGTGMCWAKPVWGSWWPWEPRLTSTFLLVVMYAVYLVLYETLVQEGHFRAVAVYNLICALNIPVVMMAPRIWRGLHPVVVRSSGIQLDPRMWTTILVGWAWSLGIYMIWTAGAARIARARILIPTRLWSHRG